MIKILSYISYILFTLWSFSSVWRFFDLYKENESTFAYYLMTFSLILLEMCSVFFILKNIGSILETLLNRIIFFWLLYSSIITTLYTENFLQDIRNAIWWPLIYFLFYYICKADKSGNLIKVFFNKFLPLIFVGNLFIFFLIRIFQFSVTSLGMSIEWASNQIYYVILLLPLFFMSSKGSRKYFVLFLVLMATVLSYKRTALLSVVLVCLICLYYDFLKQKRNITKNLIVLFIIASLFILSFSFFDDYTGGIVSSRVESIQEDNGSGRLDIYQSLINAFSGLRLEQMVFGFGYNHVLTSGFAHADGHNVSAHNDFLEVLFDFGIVGLFLYLIFIFRLFKTTMLCKTFNSKLYQACLASICFLLLMSMLSHLMLYPSYFAYIIIPFAIIQALYKTKNHSVLL